MMMSIKAVLKSDFLNEFRKSKSGVAGIVVLLFLVAMSIYAATSVPLDSFRQWNNPGYWIKYPKSAMPSWTNILLQRSSRSI